MWDSMNEYDYKQLSSGEWHIPFGDNLDPDRIMELYPEGSVPMIGKTLEEVAVMIATARCARVSYNNFEGKDDYEADIKLYDMLLASGHFSPFEHCARAMDIDEFTTPFTKIIESYNKDVPNKKLLLDLDSNLHGWSGNFRGFVQLRSTLK